MRLKKFRRSSIQEILAVAPDAKLPATWGLLKQRYAVCAMGQIDVWHHNPFETCANLADNQRENYPYFHQLPLA